MSPGSLDVPDFTPSNGTTPSGLRPTFEGYPPVYFSVGGREILYDEILLTAERIQSQAKMDTIPLPTSLPPSLSSSSVEPLTDGNANNLKAPYSWVTVDEEPEMFHDFCSVPFTKAETFRTLNSMVSWVRSLPRGSEYPL